MGDPDLAPPNALQQLLFEYLERSEDEGSSVLDELCEREPEHADALRVRVELLHGSGMRTPPGSQAAPPERLGTYRLLEPLGGGGMGVVYRAHDESLDRDVAVKIVRPTELLFPGARERFRREAEAIARLSHPGIVPVHAAGEDGGVPFLAMECVEGCTLAEALKEVRVIGRRPGSLTGDDLEAAVGRASGSETGGADASDAELFRGPWHVACARVGTRVATALQHAHDAGVLHRDVKPSNVMVTPSGRVMLVDFGLSAAEGVDRLTRTGAPLGSFPYMAPEQLDGDRERIDRRSDVYSLGVMLYELLSLRLPYEEASFARLRDAVLDARRPPLRERNERVPWELDTIVAVALDPDPARRYASCDALRRDLEAFLEGRPIAARRPGALRRVHRWVRRRPAAAALVSLVAITAVGGPVVYGLQERRARLDAEAQGRVIAGQRTELASTNDALQQALREAEEQRDAAQSEGERALRNLEHAMDSVEQFLVGLAGERLQDVPLLEGLRREMLEEGLALYEALLEDQEDVPELRLATARAAHRVGEILVWLGRPVEAEVALQRADELLHADGDLHGERLLQSIALRRQRAVSLRLQERHGEAEASLVALLQELEIGRDGEGHRRALERLRAEAALVAVLLDVGRTAELEARVERMVVELDRERAERPGDAEVLELLAAAQLELGGLLGTAVARQSVTGAPDLAKMRAACAVYERARDVLRARVELGPRDAWPRRELMRASVNLGNAYMVLRELERAKETVMEAEGMAAELAAEFPGVPMYASDRGTALGVLGAIRMQGGDRDGGVEAFEEAAEVFVELVALQPESAEPLGRLGQVRLGLARFLWEPIGDFEPAMRAADEAAESLAASVAMAPENERTRFELDVSHELRATLALELERPEDAAYAALDWAEVAADGARSRAAVEALARCALALEHEESIDDETLADWVAELRDAGARLVDRLVEIGVDRASLRADASMAVARGRGWLD
ncbi:MAG: protein kinase [Planctomycetota bacterium]